MTRCHVIWIALVCLACRRPVETEVRYVAVNPNVFVTATTVNRWTHGPTVDSHAIASHAWRIWTAINARSGFERNGTPLPVWETWYDTREVYRTEQKTKLAALAAVSSEQRDLGSLHRFDVPRQVVKQLRGAARTLEGDEPQLPPLPVIPTFNRFTREFRDHVWSHSYDRATALTKLNDSWTDATPLAERRIEHFPERSIMLKQVFWVISGKRPTPVPYWNGTSTEATTNPQMPAPYTWKQCVLADPTGEASNREPLICNEGNPGETRIPSGTYRVVRVSADPRASAFYALKLTQKEVDSLKALPSPERPLPPIEAGDFVLFVASHVATRETENWTWQTFWWSPEPSQRPSTPPDVLSPPKFVPHPWNSFVSCTAYTMVTPPDDINGTPRHCFHPYLETELFGLTDERQTKAATGVTSNCITCHRAAAWPDNFVAEAFLLKPDNARWFAGKTKTSFSWSMVLHEMQSSAPK